MFHPPFQKVSTNSLFNRWLQDVFGVPLIIMLTDDMKLLHTPNLDVSTAQRYAITNGRDILAFGFNPAKTFMFSNLAFVGGPFYENIVRVARMISVASMKRALGFNDDNNVGMFYCCSTQSAGTFATSYPDLLKSSGPDLDPNRLKNIHCLVACSWDIDGYFSEVRKHAEALGYQRPAFIYSSLLPGLQGAESKMSASVQFSSVYLTDEPMVVRAKIEHAFAEGKLDTPTVFVYLKAFLDDDAELDRMQTGFEDGTVGRNRLKEVLMQAVLEVLGSFQESREVVTREYMDKVMGKRMLF